MSERTWSSLVAEARRELGLPGVTWGQQSLEMGKRMALQGQTELEAARRDRDTVLGLG